MGVQARDDLLREGERAIAAGLSKVAMIEREYERAIELRERAFDLYKADGQLARASESANWLTFMYATYHENFSAALGWKERAESVLDGAEEGAAHSWLALLQAPFTRDLAEREQLAVSAREIARPLRRCGPRDRGARAPRRGARRWRSGRGRHAAARRGDGGRHGRPRPRSLALGEIYCRLLSACETALDVRRATDWLSMVDRYVVWTDFVRPTCRTHYGGILVALGRWAEAEAELLAAIEGFDRGHRGDRMFAALRLADLRVRQGRVEEAERLLEGASGIPPHGV